jgi:N-succinyl-L-ornithine transcarbamylase
MRNFVSINDVADLGALVEKAMRYGRDPLADRQLGAGKRAGLLFLNPSLRTRISTQLAAMNLGMEPIVLNMDKEGWALEFAEGAIMNGSTVEHILDAAPLLGAYFDVLCVRSFPGLVNREADYAETVISSFIRHTGIPVVSLESATLHPLQSLADLVTIRETFHEKRRPRVVLTWAPHIKPLPQCVANSFAQWMGAWDGADLVITHPEGYALSDQFTERAFITHDQEEALAGADYVYVKNWSSYSDYGKMPGQNTGWMLNNKKLEGTNKAKVMHCLPVRRNVELPDEVLDGPFSLVTRQGINRVCAAQAVLAEILTAES